jgi:hypothetical protein
MYRGAGTILQRILMAPRSIFVEMCYNGATSSRSNYNRGNAGWFSGAQMPTPIASTKGGGMLKQLFDQLVRLHKESSG